MQIAVPSMVKQEESVEGEIGSFAGDFRYMAWTRWRRDRDASLQLEDSGAHQQPSYVVSLMSTFAIILSLQKPPGRSMILSNVCSDS